DRLPAPPPGGGTPAGSGAAFATGAGAAAGHGAGAVAWRRHAALLGLLPFLAYTAVFLGLPTMSVVIDAFRTADGHWTLHNLSLASHGVYRTAFVTSIKISLLTAAIGTVGGTL